MLQPRCISLRFVLFIAPICAKPKLGRDVCMEASKKDYINAEIFKLLDLRSKFFYFGGTAIWSTFSILDLLVAREHFAHFLKYRVLGAAVFFSFGLVEKRSRSILNRRIYLFLGISVLAVLLETMLFQLGGHQSSYYLGIVQAGIMVICFYPAPQGSSAFAMALMMELIYAVPILLFDTITNPRQFIENNLVIITCLGMIATWRWMSDRTLINKISLQYDLAQMAEELRSRKEELEGNLTALKTTQSQLIEASKMASIGTFAAGIAHEINNPLSIMQGYVHIIRELLRKKNALDPTLESLCEKHRQGVQRIAAISNSLLAFSKKEPVEVTAVDLHEAIEIALSFVRTQYQSAGVSLELDERVKRPGVLADPAYLQQILLNILSNAKDATEGNRGPRAISVITEDSGKFTKISINDNGHGIPKELQERIFDPFFTTKAPGSGTGLGLAIVRSLVTSMNGKITVHSEVGKGTTFDIELPAVG